MPKRKETALYYWLALVFRQSIIEAVQFSRLWGKVLDAIAWLVLAALISLGLLQSGQFPAFALSWNVLVACASILLVARLVQGVLCIPPQLFFAARNENEKLKEKYEAPNPSCPLLVTRYQHQPSRSMVGIKIENPLGNQTISHLRVILDELTLCTPDGSKIQKTVDEADRGFPRGASFEPGGSINPTQYVVVFFASVSPNYMVLLVAEDYEFHDERHSSEEDPVTAPMVADYELRFSVSGFVAERPFTTSRFSARIHTESHFDEQPGIYGGWKITIDMTPPQQLAD